ncbi:hypothetical protein GQ44DRAFT_719591 [Phaeosphaeriaceae sp. PMI808]|nr:hypothetical protein GQ44DRAFT_719591 [Phaeosphaeriaceae sp. PMI808]
MCPDASSWYIQQPIVEPGPKKKKHVYVWQCCACGYPTIKIGINACPRCGTARCAYCHTTRVSVRAASQITDTNEAISHWAWAHGQQAGPRVIWSYIDFGEPPSSLHLQ